MQVAMQIALLERQTLPQLRGMWQKYFDTPPISQNKEFYISRLAYRIQELAYGGLSNHQQQLIANMYIPPEERNNLPPTGTRIVREYLGVDHIVIVLRDGFEFNGMKYQTLSAVAKKITVCQKGFTQKKDSVTIKKINSCRQKCRLKIRGRQWWNVEKQQDI